MAYLPAGVFGAGRGKVAGTVMSEARTKWGKMGTIREYVIPADPKTVLQVAQRENFRVAAVEATMFGSGIYRRGWNNALGLLPGYQALVSYIVANLKVQGASYDWVVTPALKALGPVYDGAPAPAVAAASGKIKFTWTTTIVGDYCAADDVVNVVIAHETTMERQDASYFLSLPAAAIRSAGLYESPAQFIPGDDYWVFPFIENYTDGVWRSSNMQPIKCTAKA